VKKVPFFQVKKVPFFLGLNASFKERKKYFLNKRPLFLERKCPFRSSKDSVKANFRRYRDPIFSKIFVRLVNVIKSFDFGHLQKCPFWSMPLHFRNASAASDKYGSTSWNLARVQAQGKNSGPASKARYFVLSAFAHERHSDWLFAVRFYN
jgi:hypothetical protein